MDVIQWLSRALIRNVRHYNGTPIVNVDRHGRLQIARIDYHNQSWGLIDDGVTEHHQPAGREHRNR